MTKIAVLGAGIAGQTTAFLLASRGHEVTLVDRREATACECSFANGGQLSYSHAQPWATPQLLQKIPGWLLQPHSPLLFRTAPTRQLVTWLGRFVANCRQKKMHQTTASLLGLALYSREQMHQLIATLPLDFSYAKRGTLHFFSSEKSLEHHARHAQFLEKLGCPSQRLDRAASIAKEPALAHSDAPLAGGVFYPLDESGDVRAFARGLAEHAKQSGNPIDYHYNTAITSFRHENGTIKAIQTDQGEIEADRFIIALGASSYALLKHLHLPAPLYPMKGYSLSIALENAKDAPSICLTDEAHKLVYTRLNQHLRVAGTAEFAGYDASIRKERIASLKRMILTYFPHLEPQLQQAEAWAGLRPATPDGAPLIGRTPYRNLFLNTGHGTLGWTLAAGSATIVADLVEGKDSQIDLDGLALDRYM